MLDTFSLAIAGLVTFLNIIGVSIPQWVIRDYKATDFGGRKQVGLLEYPSEVNFNVILRNISDYITKILFILTKSPTLT